jgi:hypothetical protein
MLVARISGLLTLAAITIGGSMAAMKTQASAANASVRSRLCLGQPGVIQLYVIGAGSK